MTTKSRGDKVFYLATPYTHTDPMVKKGRADVAMKAAVDLLNLGVYAFSPIAYNAPMEAHHLPGTWDFWEDYDKAFIKRCNALIVLTMDGWDASVGVAAEVVYAKQIDKDVYYLSLDQIKIGDIEHLFLPTQPKILAESKL